MIHLTARAAEWLKAGGKLSNNGEVGIPVTGYRAPIGVPACTALGLFPSETPESWCRVEDVRAMAKGWRFAYIKRKTGSVYGDTEAVDITRPTCPKCNVLLDSLLEKFVP